MLRFLLLNPFYFYFGTTIFFFSCIGFLDDSISVMILALLFLWLLFVYTAAKRKLYRDILEWKTVTGRIQSISLVDGACFFKENLMCRHRGYKILVRYFYTFEGKEYKGNRYMISDDCVGLLDRDTASKIIKSLRDQSFVKVYVDTAEPKDSVLENYVAKICYPSYIFVMLVYGSIYYLTAWIVT